MAFDFSYVDKYPQNNNYDDLKDCVFFEVYNDYDKYNYFLINGKIVETDEQYDQQTAPRIYFLPMEEGNFDNNSDYGYITKENVESVVFLGNNPEIILSYLSGHQIDMNQYFKYNFKFSK